MVILKVNKDLSTEDCIKHAKKIEEYLGEKVLILDNKVLEIGFSNSQNRDYNFYKLNNSMITLPYTTCSCDENTSQINDTTYSD